MELYDTASHASSNILWNKNGDMKGFMKTQFAVFADLHIDIMHDALWRLEKVISMALQRNVDFIIQLGDLTYPDNYYLMQRNITQRDKKAFICDRDHEKQKALQMLGDCGIPVYHVLGNHEADVSNKKAAMEYLGMHNAYYSFDKNGFHFIVLDCNYIYNGESYIDYECCNYHYCQKEQYPFLPPDQMKWLKEDILASESPCFIFSHQPLSDKINGIKNREDLWKLLEFVNRDKKRVVLCMNGHSHIDGMAEHINVPFININSISNIWLGHDYQYVRYGMEIDKRYPYLKYTAPYKDPLFAVVTIENGKIHIEGVRSEFVGPSPYDLGFSRNSSEYISTPFISDYLLPLIY